jgi:hypothetical protein
MRLAKAWGKRHRSPNDFLIGRNGDHTHVSFECDTCIFRKLKKRNPDPSSTVDKLLQACIRRMNLDVFWSRASSTVSGHKDNLRRGLKFSEMVGLQGPYVHRGPLPGYDHCGYEVAIQMLLYSRSNTGKYSSDYVQFETIRKLRSGYGNFVRGSPQANQYPISLGDEKGRYQLFSVDPCGSLWFSRFITGSKYRMGQEWRPNIAMSMDLLKAVIDQTIDRALNASSEAERHRWVVIRVYIVISYVVSLRGSEGLLLDLDGLRRHRGEGGIEYFIIALLGKIKGEHHDLAHLLPCVPVTGSGIQVQQAVHDLIDLKEKYGFRDGPAISDISGKAYSTRDIDDSLHEILEDLYDSDRDLFPKRIKDKETLKKSYQAFRTLRRTSDTRAMDMGVPDDDIDVVNRWKAVEKAKGTRPNRPMRHHYAELSLLIKPFLRYTTAM